MEDKHPTTRLAGFWIRFGAFCLDWLLLTAASYLLWGTEVVKTGTSPLTFRLDYTNVQVLLPLGYYLIFWIWRGATPGKMLCGLEIRTSENEKLRPGQAVLRLLAYIPSLLFFGIGFFWIGIDKNKQGWHDKIAGTLVVKRR